ncbi:SET domain-containing protein-lysine N-methyltransferase [Nibricoccus aquaticus]|uniref:SET domain-containing protein-lysine N-methyltransferase n=1 Tax=Nibricoccus aquaticus TaxID=2576891 RepID=A0A290Q533_9BACT|nr:SET domain-containing protein-lysine N-methyltransferase [Nibricoccus aquaticus]ATC63604.1 SET domain-containing protein-lysine N-methyltransferase [Nibricoccus aquaticus]
MSATTVKKKIKAGVSAGAQLIAKQRRRTSTPWAVVRGSAIHGRGLYAVKTIPDGTRIIAYDGEVITKAESDRREARRLAREEAGKDGCVYVFELNKRHDIDGSMSWNTARLINHSCKPNCRTEIVRGKIWIIAKREIAAGEELFFDYRYGFATWREHPCRCGTERCVGFIVAGEYRWRVRKILKAERVAAKKAERITQKRRGGV